MIYDLGDFSIAADATHTGTPIDDITMSTLALSARFAYGSGGTSVIAVVQTSLDQGTTWIDIARFDFATAGLEKVMNLTRAAVTSPYTVTSLVAEGSNNGILGDRLRAVVTSTGIYTGSTVLAIRAFVL